MNSKPKVYKRIFWETIERGNTHIRVAESLTFHHLKDGKGKVRCDICWKIIGKCSQDFWFAYFTISDQRHLDSEAHQDNLTLRKLANENKEI